MFSYSYSTSFVARNLLLEMGYDQRDKIERIIAGSGAYDHVEFSKDYAGYDRVVIMRKR